MSTNLTSEAFWTNYWSNIILPQKVNFNFKNDRVIAHEILQFVEERPHMSALEVGCAPGKWLSFLAIDLKCDITGIEYVQIAAEKTAENLKLQNIQNFEIISGDFFTHQFDKKFDLVISLGFIEHFSHYDKVLENQLALVAPDGYLIVGIPRFKGINYFLQKCIDFFIQNKLIHSHNLSIMNLQTFEHFAESHKLKILSNRFIGGFEPGLFPVGEINNVFARIVLKTLSRSFNLLFGSINSYFTSSYQIAIFKK